MTSPSLDEAFAYIETLSRRPEFGSAPVMSDQQWDQAVTAAVSRGDRSGLAILLEVELAPALAHAMGALGATVQCAIELSESHSDEHELELSNQLEPTQLAVMRAGKTTWAGEHREGLLPEHAGPSSPPAHWGERMVAKMGTYFHMELASDDVHQAIADDLGRVLRSLTGSARAAIECVGSGNIDELLAHPLQQDLFDAYHALSAVRLYLLAKHMTHATLEWESSGGLS